MEDNSTEEPLGQQAEKEEPVTEEKIEGVPGERPLLEEELADLRDKYLRLYAEFENYKKRMAKEKEGLIKYAHESLIYELLPSLDHLEIALKHSDNDILEGLREGVEITLKELLRTLEKFGLSPIESTGKQFNPEFHHAMSQVERDDVEENTVVEELRRGFIFGDKVLRASLVAVSKKLQKDDIDINQNNIEEEE